jgi:glycosyltransferase involved in cell wall biosynthesis
MRQVKFWADRRHVATVLITDSNLFDHPRNWVLENAKKMFVRRFDSAFAAGTGASQYLTHLGIPPERVALGCDVVDVTEFTQRANDLQNNGHQVFTEPDQYFLFVGRLIKEKNVLRLLEAYERYFINTVNQLTPWNLMICGNGPEEAAVRGRIDLLEPVIRKGILLKGYVKQPEIIDLFADAACFILPSTSEPWGLVINEALACGLPVIVSNRCGSSLDLVKEDFNGWTFDPFTADQLAYLMEKMTFLNEKVRKEMGQNGQDLISEWNLEKFTQGAMESAQIAIDHKARQRK